MLDRIYTARKRTLSKTCGHLRSAWRDWARLSSRRRKDSSTCSAAMIASPGRGVLEAHDMPRVFATYQPVALLQPQSRNGRPHWRARTQYPRSANASSRPRLLIRVPTTPPCNLPRSCRVTGNDEQQLITIDDGTGMINHQYPVAVTIKGNTQVRTSATTAACN
jgi:hypothetical protein